MWREDRPRGRPDHDASAGRLHWGGGRPSALKEMCRRVSAAAGIDGVVRVEYEVGVRRPTGLPVGRVFDVVPALEAGVLAVDVDALPGVTMAGNRALGGRSVVKHGHRRESDAP